MQWSDSTAAVGDSVYEITFTGRILDGWHTYDLHSGFSSTVIAFELKFGADLNAYTSFDETVYVLPIPTNKKENLEKGFLVLEDWAHGLKFNPPKRARWSLPRTE